MASISRESSPPETIAGQRTQDPLLGLVTQRTLHGQVLWGPTTLVPVGFEAHLETQSAHREIPRRRAPVR